MLKPNDEYGGKGIVLGWLASEEEWNQTIQIALEHPYIVQARVEIPCYGTTHADYAYGEIPCTAVMSDEQIKRDYEEETGVQITDCFKERSPVEVPMVIVAGLGATDVVGVVGTVGLLALLVASSPTAVRWVSLVNLVAEREVVPEMLQERASAEELSSRYRDRPNTALVIAYSTLRSPNSSSKIESAVEA